MTALPCLCINLASRPDRWARMAARFRRAGLAAERFPATDGLALARTGVPASLVEPEFDTTPIARFAARVTPGQRVRLSVGELGCTLSHLAAWSAIAERGAPATLVVEDDVDFAPDLVPRVLERLARLDPGWDLVYLGWDASPARPRPFRADLAVPIYHFGTFAYLISAKGAEQLLGLLPVIGPIDTFLAAHFDALQVFCCDPPLVIPEAGSWTDSNVEHSCVRG